MRRLDRGVHRASTVEHPIARLVSMLTIRARVAPTKATWAACLFLSLADSLRADNRLTRTLWERVSNSASYPGCSGSSSHSSSRSWVICAFLSYAKPASSFFGWRVSSQTNSIPTNKNWYSEVEQSLVLSKQPPLQGRILKHRLEVTASDISRTKHFHDCSKQETSCSRSWAT